MSHPQYGMSLGGSSVEVWAGVFSSVFEATTWFKGNDTIILFACTLGSGEVQVPQGYLRAILASDGVAVFWVFDKRHIHTNQGSPICGHYLASDQRNQAERKKTTKQNMGALDTCRKTERRDSLYSSSLLWLLPYSCLVLKLGEEHQC